MASIVWRKALGNLVTPILLLLSLGGLAIIALNPDAGVLDKAEKVIEQGQVIVSALAVLGVIFLGGTQISLELQDGSAMFWLARPLARWRYVVGKMLGASFIGWGMLVVLGGALAVMFVARGIFPPASYYTTLAADALRVLILAALLTCLSTGLGYMQTTFIGGMICLMGFASYALPIYATLLGTSVTSGLFWMIYWLVPCWDHFGFGLEIGTTNGVTVYWLLLALYSLAYATIFTLLAVLGFQWRDVA